MQVVAEELDWSRPVGWCTNSTFFKIECHSLCVMIDDEIYQLTDTIYIKLLLCRLHDFSGCTPAEATAEVVEHASRLNVHRRGNVDRLKHWIDGTITTFEVKEYS